MQNVPLDTTLTIAQVTQATTYGKSTLRAFAKSGVLKATLVRGRGQGTYYVTLFDLLHFCQEMEITPDLSFLSLSGIPQAAEEPPPVAPPPPPPAVPSRIVVMPPTQLTEQLARTGPFFEEEDEQDEDDWDEGEREDTWGDERTEGSVLPIPFCDHEFTKFGDYPVLYCPHCLESYRYQKDQATGQFAWVLVPLKEKV